MKIVTFSTLKGGVGKSSAVFNISGILAEDNKKILVIDADSQGNTTNNFGIDRTKKEFKSIVDIIETNERLEDVIIKRPIKDLDIDVIGSTIFLTSTEMRIVNQTGREYVLRNYIKKNVKKFNEYDYIIFDTSPSMGIVNQNAFLISDEIILVSDVSLNSLEGAELFIALWDDITSKLDIKNHISGFMINMYDKRIKLSKEFKQYCIENEDIKGILFDQVIHTNVRLKESELESKPICILDKKSSGYKDYMNLVLEMKGRGIF